jgi:hypothetical protein
MVGSNKGEGMKIIAIDPGPIESAYVVFEDEEIGPHGKMLNVDLSKDLAFSPVADMLVIEMIASYGMPVGQTTFETCVWIGVFATIFKGPYSLVYRREVKREICGSPHAKDGNIRQALIDRFGPAGTKKAPGPTYGISKDVWSALAVAATFEDMGRPIRKLLAEDPEELEKWTKKQDDKREKRKKKRLVKEAARNAAEG